VKQQSDVAVGFGVTGQQQFAVVGGGDAHVDELDVGEFFKDGARHQSGGDLSQVLSEGDREAVGEKGDKEVSFDAVGAVMPDGADGQIAFEGAEGFFDEDQLHVVAPQGVGLFVGQVGAQQVAAFATARLS